MSRKRGLDRFKVAAGAFLDVENVPSSVRYCIRVTSAGRFDGEITLAGCDKSIHWQGWGDMEKLNRFETKLNTALSLLRTARSAVQRARSFMRRPRKRKARG